MARAKTTKAKKENGAAANGNGSESAASKEEKAEAKGVDLTADDASLPHNFEHVGDGSPEKPHQVRPVQRWS